MNVKLPNLSKAETLELFQYADPSWLKEIVLAGFKVNYSYIGGDGDLEAHCYRAVIKRYCGTDIHARKWAIEAYIAGAGDTPISRETAGFGFDILLKVKGRYCFKFGWYTEIYKPDIELAIVLAANLVLAKKSVNSVIRRSEMPSDLDAACHFMRALLDVEFDGVFA